MFQRRKLPAEPRWRVGRLLGYVFKNNLAPVIVGEFGSKLETVSDQQWMDRLTDYMDGDFDLNGSNDLAAGKKGIIWTMWCFNPNSGDTGGIVGDDWQTVNTTKLAYIQPSMAPLLGSSNSAPTASFTVTMSTTATQAVSVAWTTQNATALAGIDFTAASGTLTFAAGETSKVITITLLPNSAQTQTRAFHLLLGSPSNATLADSTALAAITPSTPWHTWLVARFSASALTNTTLTDELADPDGDGVANLLEYATARNPVSNDASPASAAWSGGTLEFIYTRNKAATDVTYTVEWSDDMAIWSAAGVTQSVLTDGTTIQEIKALVPASVVRRFVRLNVSR